MNRKERRAGKSRARVKDDDALLRAMTAEGLSLYQAGRLSEAEQMYKQALTLRPDYAEALHLLGVLANDTGHYDMAVGLIGDAIEVEGNNAFYHNNLGNALKNAGKLDAAALAYKRAVMLQPAFAEPHNALGVMAMDRGDFEEAERYLKKAIALRPAYAEAQFNMGCLHRRRGAYEDALPFFEQTIALRPTYAEAYLESGHCWKMLERYDLAEDILRRVLAFKPDYAEALINLGKVLLAQGRGDEGIALMKTAVAARPDQVIFLQDLAFSVIYASDATPEDSTAPALQFGAQWADPLYCDRPFPNDPSPDRPLRIGYVSPDFCTHPIASFIEPLLETHDRTAFTLYAYANVERPDAVTERLRAHFDFWRDIVPLDDDAAAALIEADKIDILVDLAGHTGGNRLMVFARKPAPVQLSWLGHPATTGMKAMDYRITDNLAEPEGMTEHLNTERLWRLPHIYGCYRGCAIRPAIVAHPPADDNGHITFGCFNNVAKLSPSALETWARILDALPDARLLLEVQGITHSACRARMETRLQQYGLPMDRVILEPRKAENRLVLYNRIDIALDPFPYAGGTTTMDALWMGVPVLTYAGRQFASRMGVSLVTNAGLAELVASSMDDYVAKAVAMAQDKDSLRALRTHLHDHVEESPLMDKVAFTHDLEEAYRTMWHIYCHNH